jgi:hypothetical protein
VASEQVLDIPVRRHVLTSERPFQVVLDGIYNGISQPDTGALFTKLAACASYEELSALVGQAQGSAGLIRFLHLDLDTVLTLDPQARDQAGRRLVRLIAGNPVTMGQMTRHTARGRLLRAGHHPHPGTGRRRHPGRLRHRHQRHRALPERPRLPGRPAAGHRSPPSPAPRDRHTPNRPAAVPDHVVAQPRTALNASPESRRTRADRACRRGRHRRSDDHESNQHQPSIR